MSIYEVNSTPTIEKIEKYDDDIHMFYRFQNKDWEMGEESWGMIFSTREEAIESAEEWGMTEEEAVLPGKSACNTAKELASFSGCFGNEYRVIVINGDQVGYGHDDEAVVDSIDIIEIWDYDDFMNLINNLED